VGTLKLAVPQDLKKGPSALAFLPATSETRRLWCWRLCRWVGGGRLHQQAQGDNRGALWYLFLQEPGFTHTQLASALDSELEACRSRRLEAEAYPYLFVDARYEKVRVDGRVVNQGVLVVSAVRDDGMREILAVEVAHTQSEATYHELFRSLNRRGLKGVQLVVSDDHEGLKRARRV
jgi:Transposase, Mutator family